MTEPLSVTKFLAIYLPALFAVTVVPAPEMPLGERFLIDFWGLPVPVVTCVLGALGIAASRPFTRRSEEELGWKLRWLVTLIMLVVLELWIIESRPGWLFAFVVAIGLGFGGYSLLETFGNEAKAFLQRAIEGAANTIGKGPGEQ